MSVTNSLRNLKTNYIGIPPRSSSQQLIRCVDLSHPDLLLLHYPDLLMDADEVAKAFTILRDDVFLYIIGSILNLIEINL